MHCAQLEGWQRADNRFQASLSGRIHSSAANARIHCRCSGRMPLHHCASTPRGRALLHDEAWQ